MNIKGALFKAKEKRSENSPDYTGSIEVDGKKLNLAGWIKKSQSGITYISLAASEMKEKVQGASYSPMDDDVPF